MRIDGVGGSASQARSAIDYPSAESSVRVLANSEAVKSDMDGVGAAGAGGEPRRRGIASVEDAADDGFCGLPARGPFR